MADGFADTVSSVSFVGAAVNGATDDTGESVCWTGEELVGETVNGDAVTGAKDTGVADTGAETGAEDTGATATGVRVTGAVVPAVIGGEVTGEALTGEAVTGEAVTGEAVTTTPEGELESSKVGIADDTKGVGAADGDSGDEEGCKVLGGLVCLGRGAAEGAGVVLVGENVGMLVVGAGVDWVGAAVWVGGDGDVVWDKPDTQNVMITSLRLMLYIRIPVC